MITLNLSEKQLGDLYDEILSNANPRARMKCLIVYLRAKGHPRHEIADIAPTEDTVTNAVKKYVQGDLASLLTEGYRKPKSQLGSYSARLNELFEKAATSYGQPGYRNDF